MNPTGAPSLVGILVVSALLGVLPLLAVTMTSFTKIAVVLLIVRNALGIQQTPPNLLVYGISIILTVFVMAPVGQQVYAVVSNPALRYDSIQDYERVGAEAVAPVKAFLARYANEDNRRFFVEATRRVWKEDTASLGPNDLPVLVPSFVVSELTRAFEIGFLLYLPFLMIDFAVSAILIAMGMQQMSPPTISTPLKLLLFVAVDGWGRLVEGLVLSYAVP